MKTIPTAMAALAILALSGCGQKNNADVVAADNSATKMGPTDGPAMTAPTASAGQMFANAAAASDAFEIETSRLALANSSSKAIKAYAQKMIDAHTASTAKLKAAAASAAPAITPDPALTPEQSAKLDSLKSLKGVAFDSVYIEAQQGAHQMTLDTLRAYSLSGDVLALKTLAGQMVPTVAAHLNMAKTLKA